MNHHCRKYRTEDLRELQGLMAQLGYPMELPELHRNISEIYKKGGEILIAEKDGVAVASICVLVDARLAEGVCAEIVSLVVSENERGKGIGSLLIKEAEAWARERVDKIRVRANAIRDNAHLFYMCQGFAEIKTQKVFLKRL